MGVFRTFGTATSGAAWAGPMCLRVVQGLPALQPRQQYSVGMLLKLSQGHARLAQRVNRGAFEVPSCQRAVQGTPPLQVWQQKL